MRLSLRFIIPLVLALAAIAYAVVPLVDRLTLRWFVRDLEMRSSLIANTVHEPLQDLILAGNRNKMLQFFTRITQDQRLYAIGRIESGTERSARDQRALYVNHIAETPLDAAFENTA